MNRDDQLLRDLYSMIDNVPDADVPELKAEVLEALHRLDRKLACQRRAEVDFEKKIRPVITDLFKVDDLRHQDGDDSSSSDDSDGSDDERSEEPVVATPRKLEEEIGQRELLNIMRKNYKELVDGYNDVDLRFTLEVLVPTTSSEENEGSAELYDGNLDATIVYKNIDPITKGKIQIPVKNMNCDHIYCRISITAMLQNRPDGIKCPYSICSSQQLFTVSDLVDFPVFFDLCKEPKDDGELPSATTTA